MLTIKFLVSLFLAILLATCACAEQSTGLYITIINGTPYEWKRVDTYKNKVDGYIALNLPELQLPWEWPEAINAGKSHTSYVSWDEGVATFPKRPGEAYVTYSLQGVSQPASFKIRVSHNDKMVYAEYLDNLESLGGNTKGSIIKIGYSDSKYSDYYPGESFILAGSEGSFISTNPPSNWMQAMLPTIGNRTLRELMLPASHNSGMSTTTFDRGGHDRMSLTQTLSIYEQLKAGIRILDIRPSFWVDNSEEGPGGKVRCGNLRPNQKKVWIGATGLDIKDVVAQVNQFNNEVPGELILIQVKFMDWHFEDIGKKWNYLTAALSKLQHRQNVWLPAEGPGSDLGSWHLNSFIEGQKSSVVVLMPKRWLEFYRSPGIVGANGIIQNKDTTDFDFYFDHDPAYFAGSSPPGPSEEGYLAHGQDEPYPLDLSGVLPISENHTVSPDAYTVDNTTYMDNNALEIVGDHWQGFFKHDHFNWHNEYSNENLMGPMSRKQYDALQLFRRTPYDEPFMLKWIVTQSYAETYPHFVDNVDKWDNGYDPAEIAYKDTFHTIRGLGTRVNARLFDTLWRWCTTSSYPNGVEIDNVRDSQVTALVMAANLWFGGHYERDNGLEPGTGRSLKPDEYILAAMAAQSETYAMIDQQTADAEKESFRVEVDNRAGVLWKPTPWAPFEGYPQTFERRFAVCTENEFGKICSGDD